MSLALIYTLESGYVGLFIRVYKYIILHREEIKANMDPSDIQRAADNTRRGTVEPTINAPPRPRTGQFPASEWAYFNLFKSVNCPVPYALEITFAHTKIPHLYSTLQIPVPM